MRNAVALVTGASRGIGRGVALELGRSGMSVAVNYATREDAALEVAAELQALGVEAAVFRADVAQAADREALVAGVLDRFGRLDLLVNNAGVGPRVRADILEAGEEEFSRVLATNLQGPYFLTQRVAREMIRLRAAGVVPTPRIVFVGSVSARLASTNRGEYCISKAGLHMAVRLFALRLAAEGIPVLEVQPGIIATDMTAGVREKYDQLIAGGAVPQGRWGTPEDVARVVRAIAEGAFDFCTGQAIEVGGGLGIPRL